MTNTCWAITAGEYSDYRILAVFSDEQTARDRMDAWGIYADEFRWDYLAVEPFPFNVLTPDLPRGFRGWKCCRQDGVIDVTEEDDHKYVARSGQSIAEDDWNGELKTYVFARNEQHAIKIASERFTRHDAENLFDQSLPEGVHRYQITLISDSDGIGVPVIQAKKVAPPLTWHEYRTAKMGRLHFVEHRPITDEKATQLGLRGSRRVAIRRGHVLAASEAEAITSSSPASGR